jgi:O-antigen/teichoic acid export membrane protein
MGLVYAASLLLLANGTSIGALRLCDAYARVEAVNVLQAALLLANAILLYLLDLPLSVYLFTIPVITGLCGMFIVVLGFLRLRACDPRQGRARFDRAARRRFLNFAFGVSASGTLTVVRRRGEILIVGAVLGPMAAALYGVAYRVGALLSRFAEAARVSVYPEFSRMVAARQFPEAVRIAVRLARLTALPAAVAVLAAWAVGADVLGLLFGAEYRAAAPMLVLLTIGAGVYLSIFGISSLVQIRFGSWRFFFFNLCAFAGFAVFAALGPARFGLAGAGAGAVAFSTILAGLCALQIMRGR